MYNPLDLTGKRILITGASAGIGRACAVAASKLGAQVVLVARRRDALDEALKMLDGSGHTAISYDLGDIDNVEGLLKEATAGGVLSGFVHSAGMARAVPVQSMDTETLQTMMTLNFFSFMAIMKFLVRKKYCAGGSVVAISSVAAQAGWQGVSAYSGTKGALSASVRSLAIELVPRGIRVNSIMPSHIKTEMYDSVVGHLSDSHEAQVLARQPLGLGSVEDVANAAAFLLSDASRFITGIDLAVDGGYLAQ